MDEMNGENIPPREVMAKTEIIYDGPEGKILFARSADACRFWAGGTSWDVAKENNKNAFEQWSAWGDVLIGLPEPSDAERQLFTDMNSFKFASKIEWLPGTDMRAPFIYNEHGFNSFENIFDFEILPCWERLVRAAQKQENFYRIDYNTGYDWFSWRTPFPMDPQELSWLPDDKEQILHVLEARCHDIGQVRNVFKYVSEELKEDPEFMRAAINLKPGVFEFASCELRSDKEFVASVANKLESTISAMDKSLVRDRAFIQKIAPSNLYAHAYAAREIKDEPLFMLKARLKSAWQGISGLVCPNCSSTNSVLKP